MPHPAVASVHDAPVTEAPSPALMRGAVVAPDFGLVETALPRPLPGPTDTLIRVTGCSICGSDLDKVANRRCQPGDVLGHEVTGVVVATPKDGPLSPGQRVVAAHHVPCGQCHYCRQESPSMCRQFKATNIRPGGFAQYIAVSADHAANTVFPIPDDTSDAEASCVEPLACVLRAIERGNAPKPPGTVAIVGLGFIGLLAGAGYKRQGATVFGLERLPERNGFALAHHYIDEALQPDALEAKLQTLPANGVDVVFLSVCTPGTWALAQRLVRDGGRIILFGAHHTPNPEQEAFIHPASLYFREVSLVPSYSPSLESLQQAADWVFSRKINVAQLVTHRLPLSRIQTGLTLYQQSQALKVWIDMPPEDAAPCP